MQSSWAHKKLVYFLWSDYFCVRANRFYSIWLRLWCQYCSLYFTICSRYCVELCFVQVNPSSDRYWGSGGNSKYWYRNIKCHIGASLNCNFALDFYTFFIVDFYIYLKKELLLAPVRFFQSKLMLATVSHVLPSVWFPIGSFSCIHKCAGLNVTVFPHTKSGVPTQAAFEGNLWVTAYRKVVQQFISGLCSSESCRP